MSVRAETMPKNALLQRYAQDPLNYTDCYVKDVAGTIGLSEFMVAFYTTRLFRAERFVLKIAARKPSADADARAVADGNANTFAIWTVEDRTHDQALLCDMAGHTRSWFMVKAIPDGTRLYFGSAVTPNGLLAKVLTPLHRLYSRGLLGGAKPQQSGSADH
jgi:hypothetical protein